MDIRKTFLPDLKRNNRLLATYGEQCINVCRRFDDPARLRYNTAKWNVEQGSYILSNA